MAETATTVQQIVLLVLFVLPGISFQFVRQRLRGPVPGERDVAERVLRAVTASLALDGLYLITIGPWLVHLVKAPHRPWFAAASASPREAAAVGLGLFIAIPAAAAWCISRLERGRRAGRYDAAPTAWDSAFSRRTSCFVRARLNTGIWVGGWYGKQRSRASGYPHAADIFLESAYEMGEDGSFGPRVQGTSGLYLRMEDVDVLEFVEPASSTWTTGAGRPEEDVHA